MIEPPCEVAVNCPVCCAQNYFDFERDHDGETLACNDCGFTLMDAQFENLANRETCLFCGNDSFYLDDPFPLPLLPPDMVCYVCEARYKKDVGGKVVGTKYREESAAEARRTLQAARWRKRAEGYEAGGV